MGLILNRDAVIAKRSLPTLMAVGTALTGNVSPGFFEAITDDMKEAAKLKVRHEMAKKSAEPKGNSSGKFR